MSTVSVKPEDLKSDIRPGPATIIHGVSEFPDLIREAMKAQPEASIISLDHSSVRINIHCRTPRRFYPGFDVGEIWFKIKTGRKLSIEEIKQAIALFDNGSNMDRITVYSASATHIQDHRVDHIDNALRLYSQPDFHLRKVDEEVPLSYLSGEMVNGPVEVPTHGWRSICISFVTSIPGHPEFGSTRNAIILLEDGVLLRAAESANLLHAMSPALNSVLSGIEGDLSDTDIASLLLNCVPKSEVAALADPRTIQTRLSKASEPYINLPDLIPVSEFVSQLLDSDIKRIPFRVVRDI